MPLQVLESVTPPELLEAVQMLDLYGINDTSLNDVRRTGVPVLAQCKLVSAHGLHAEPLLVSHLLVACCHSSRMPGPVCPCLR